MTLDRISLLLVGYGKMGSAIHKGIRHNNKYKIYILDPNNENGTKSPGDLPIKSFDIIILAVKPQIFDEVCLELNEHVTSALYISIAAGKTLKSIEDIFVDKSAIVRTMPNTPAMIGKGMTVGVANSITQQYQLDIVRSLFGTLGNFEWVDDEGLMDAVTALSGSGPAYVFLLIEKLAEAGIALGLPAETAMNLARQTVIGSAALAESEADIPAATLRQNVTSPGGTTEAALKILMHANALGEILQNALKAAADRSRQLS